MGVSFRLSSFGIGRYCCTDRARSTIRQARRSLNPISLIRKATERLAEIIANGAPVTMEDDAERDGFRWWYP